MTEQASQRVSETACLAWLKRGWQDFLRVPALSLLHGAVLALSMLAIVAIGYSQAVLLAGAFSGFVLVAPALVVGMYAQSRALELGETTGFATVGVTWRRVGPTVVRYGLLLALLGSAWVLCSSIIVSASAVEAGGVRGYLSFFAGASNPLLFWLWLLAGGLLAALVFAASAISLPMLIDRPELGVRAAMLASIKAVGDNPVAMVIWAIVIMGLTLLSIVSVVGLLVLIPVLGHASWHAYRDLTGAV
ncbi:MAG: DUF2189 domain-containing protein [Burkholderiaceae bacterium]